MATVNKDFRVKNGLIVEGTTGTINNNNILTDADTTDSLDEGTTNLYYTDQKVRDVLTGSTQTNISITEVDGDLVITAENGVADSDTDDLSEGTTNLYFTTSRAVGAVEAALAADEITTDDISEGTTNLYFTVEKVEDVIADATTDDIDEGTTNFYYTDVRVRNALSSGTGILFSTSGVIAVDTDTIATKSYVDEVAEGLSVKPAVDVATTANITATYANGTSGVGATLTIAATATLTIDTKDTWEQYDSVLFKNQSTAAHNGRYVLTTVGNAGTAWVFTRCSLCDEADEIPGTYTFVKDGTQAGTGWVQIVDNPDTFVVGTDDIDIIQFSDAGAYTAGTGIALNGNEFSIDFTEFDTDDIDEGTTNLYFTDTKAVDAVRAAVDGGTQTNISVTYSTSTGKFNFVAENGVADSTTNDLTEGTTNLYFTNTRAVDAIRSAVDGGTQTNISVTYSTSTGKFNFVAENGVADSTTDNLTEGTTNLYFTNARAVTALEAVVPDFTAVEVNNVARQVAASITVESLDTPEAVLTFAKASYRSAKVLVKTAFGNHTEVSEILLTLDTSDNIAITEYAEVATNGSLADITADISGSNVRLMVDVNNNNSIVSAYATLLP